MERQEILEYLREQIEIHVRCGYGTEEDVLDQVEEQVRDELGPEPSSCAGELISEANRSLADQRQEEETWNELTVNDCIDRAFAELADRGIIALQDAGYTMSDGWDDIADAQDSNSRGGTFFHRQDVERGVGGEGLQLSYGAFARGDTHEPETLRLAREICDVLEHHKVSTEWDGTIDQRIRILPFRWQKRRTTVASV